MAYSNTRLEPIYILCTLREQLKHQSFLHEAKILQYLQHDIHTIPIQDDDEMRKCQELYSSKYESTQCSSTQSAFTCSKLTTETLQQGVKYVQS